MPFNLQNEEKTRKSIGEEEKLGSIAVEWGAKFIPSHSLVVVLRRRRHCPCWQ